MGSTSGPEAHLPAVIHLPTLLNRVAGGCKFVMVHPKGEGISFQSSLRTHPKAQLQASSIVPQDGRGRMQLFAQGVCK
jgi:hypothetical protein